MTFINLNRNDMNLHTSYNGTLLKISHVSFIDAMQMDFDSTDNIYCIVAMYGNLNRSNKALVKANDMDQAIQMFRCVCKHDNLLNERYLSITAQRYCATDTVKIFDVY